MLLCGRMLGRFWKTEGVRGTPVACPHWQISLKGKSKRFTFNDPRVCEFLNTACLTQKRKTSQCINHCGDLVLVMTGSPNTWHIFLIEKQL